MRGDIRSRRGGYAEATRDRAPFRGDRRRARRRRPLPTRPGRQLRRGVLVTTAMPGGSPVWRPRHRFHRDRDRRETDEHVLRRRIPRRQRAERHGVGSSSCAAAGLSPCAAPPAGGARGARRRPERATHSSRSATVGRDRGHVGRDRRDEPRVDGVHRHLRRGPRAPSDRAAARTDPTGIADARLRRVLDLHTVLYEEPRRRRSDRGTRFPRWRGPEPAARLSHPETLDARAPGSCRACGARRGPHARAVDTRRGTGDRRAATSEDVALARTGCSISSSPTTPTLKRCRSPVTRPRPHSTRNPASTGCPPSTAPPGRGGGGRRHRHRGRDELRLRRASRCSS